MSLRINGGFWRRDTAPVVNYSDNPVEGVSLSFPSKYTNATLLTPEGARQKLEPSPSAEGSMVTLDSVAVCATIELEQSSR
jgi:hypothetical protein